MEFITKEVKDWTLSDFVEHTANTRKIEILMVTLILQPENDCKHVLSLLQVHFMEHKQLSDKYFNHHGINLKF
jgi:hypothetical protein